MGRLVRVGDPAANLTGVECSIAPLIKRVQVVLTAHNRICKIAEERRRFVPLLAFALGKIDALGEKATGCAGLETFNLKA